MPLFQSSTFLIWNGRGVNFRMRLSELKELLKCQLISPCDLNLDIDIQFAYASDLMSDILVAVKPGALLIAGLTNNQVIRTDKVAVSSAIVLVRGKKPIPKPLNWLSNIIYRSWLQNYLCLMFAVYYFPMV